MKRANAPHKKSYLFCSVTNDQPSIAQKRVEMFPFQSHCCFVLAFELGLFYTLTQLYFIVSIMQLLRARQPGRPTCCTGCCFVSASTKKGATRVHCFYCFIQAAEMPACAEDDAASSTIYRSSCCCHGMSLFILSLM